MKDFDRVVTQLNDGLEADAREELEKVIARWRALEAAAAGATRRRPWIATWRALDDAVAAIRVLTENYLDVLAAASPLEAQALGPRLQTAIDSAATSASELSERVERFAAIPGPGPEGNDLVALAEGAFAHTGASDLLEFDRRGAEVGSRITGGREVPAGMGVQLAMKRIAVEAVLDETRFHRVGSESYLALAAKPQALGLTCSDPQWFTDMTEATIAARDAATVAEALAQAAWNERLEVGAVIALGHALVEGPAKMILASLLAVLTGKTYARLREADSGDLIKKARSAGIGNWIEGLDEAVRNAHAHADWTLVGGTVQLRPGKPGAQTRDVADLIDLVLRGVESLAALDAALVLAAGSVGVDFSGVDWRNALSLNDENAARLMLAVAGWRHIEVALRDGSLFVSASAPSSAFSIGTLGALTSTMGSNVGFVHLTVSLTDGPMRVLEGPASLLRALEAASDDQAKGIATAELLHRFRLDGEPLADRDYVRRWSTSVIIKALQSPLKHAIKMLRDLRELANRIGDEDLAQLTAGSMTLARLLATGDIASPFDTPTFKQIEAWAKMKVDLADF